MSLLDKVVAVTGVSAGLGRALATGFAERGARVIGCARREREGKELEDQIRSAGYDFGFIRADVTSPADCRTFIDSAVDRHGRLDVLINNVGGMGRTAFCPIAEITPEHWNETFAINVNSTLFCSQRAIRHMKAAGRGTIINIASTQGVLATATQGHYCAAKAAVLHLTKCMAVEHMNDGIRVNAIIMGAMATEMMQAAIDESIMAIGEGQNDYGQTALRPIPLEDITSALVALAGDDTSIITGATISLDRCMNVGALHSSGIFQALSGNWENRLPTAQGNL